ncbi:hypothetical protein [Vibrio phage R01]|nr:hypothetical protein [Vibrio phage R01]
MSVTGSVILLVLLMEALSWGFYLLWTRLVKSGRVAAVKFGKRRHWADLNHTYDRIYFRGFWTPFVMVTERDCPIPEFTKNHPDELASAAVRSFVQKLIDDSSLVLDTEAKDELFRQYELWMLVNAMPDNGYALIEDWREQLNPANDGEDDE